MDQGISLLSALKSRMSWLSDRQKVVSQNVANASTPGFKPKDLTPQDFASLLNSQNTQTIPPIRLSDGTPLLMPDDAGGHKTIVKPDSETTMDGNSVVLEEQMLKMSESRQQFEAAIGFYEKSLAMVRMASKAPGK